MALEVGRKRLIQMVSARLKARIQAKVGTFLTDTCLIEAEADTYGEFGEPLHTWTTVASDVPCRVIRAGRRTQGAAEQVGGQEAIVEIYRLIVPAGTALGVDQRVTVNGTVFQVIDVIDAWTDGVDAQAIMTRAR